MARPVTTSAVREQHVCWKAVALAALVLAVSPRLSSGILVLLGLLLICGIAQLLTHETGDALDRKA